MCARALHYDIADAGQQHDLGSAGARTQDDAEAPTEASSTSEDGEGDPVRLPPEQQESTTAVHGDVGRSAADVPIKQNGADDGEELNTQPDTEMVLPPIIVLPSQSANVDNLPGYLAARPLDTLDGPMIHLTPPPPCITTPRGAKRLCVATGEKSSCAPPQPRRNEQNDPIMEMMQRMFVTTQSMDGKVDNGFVHTNSRIDESFQLVSKRLDDQDKRMEVLQKATENNQQDLEKLRKDVSKQLTGAMMEANKNHQVDMESLHRDLSEEIKSLAKENAGDESLRDMVAMLSSRIDAIEQTPAPAASSGTQVTTRSDKVIVTGFPNKMVGKVVDEIVRKLLVSYDVRFNSKAVEIKVLGAQAKAFEVIFTEAAVAKRVLNSFHEEDSERRKVMVWKNVKKNTTHRLYLKGDEPKHIQFRGQVLSSVFRTVQEQAIRASIVLQRGDLVAKKWQGHFLILHEENYWEAVKVTNNTVQK